MPHQSARSQDEELKKGGASEIKSASSWTDPDHKEGVKVVILLDQQRLDEEREKKIHFNYKTQESSPEHLLAQLQAAIKKLEMTNPIYSAAASVYLEGKKLLKCKSKLSKDDELELKKSVVLALNLVKNVPIKKTGDEKHGPDQINPKNQEDYVTAIRLLKANAKNGAVGKASLWTKLKGALFMLAGAAYIALGLAGLPFSFGVTMGLTVGGGVVFAGGMGLFAAGRQKSIAKKLAKLGDVVEAESKKPFTNN